MDNTSDTHTESTEAIQVSLLLLHGRRTSLPPALQLVIESLAHHFYELCVALTKHDRLDLIHMLMERQAFRFK